MEAVPRNSGFLTSVSDAPKSKLLKTYLRSGALLLFGFFFTGAALPARGESDAAMWWHGRHLTGDWLGARPAVEAGGVKADGHWRAIYFGILESEGGSGNAFSQELAFALELEAEQLSGWQGLRGWTGFIEGRWRAAGTEANPNEEVGAVGLFNPSRYVGGNGWRLLSVGARYVAGEFFGVAEGLSLAGGWIQPQREFITQPLARLFANNALASSEGIGANVDFGSSFSTWGGTVEVRPVEKFYAKTGVFMSYDNPTDPANRGLSFRGGGGDNGLLFMGEMGVTPELGPSRLPGHYAFGGYFNGEDRWTGDGNKFGFYGQADQMLWREAGAQGLRLFSLFYFAPSYNNNFSFYSQGGLVYEGLIPHRDRDQFMAGVAVGQYGDAARRDARGPAPNQSVLVEAGYRFQLNGWSFVQPFAQYIVQPAGTTAVANAALLGVFIGVDF